MEAQTQKVTKTIRTQQFGHNHFVPLYVCMHAAMHHTSTKNHFAMDSTRIPPSSPPSPVKSVSTLKSVITFTHYSHCFAKAEHIVPLCVNTKNFTQPQTKYLQMDFFQ